MEVRIEKKNDNVTLIVKNGAKTLSIPAYSSVAQLNDKSIEIGSVAVYVDKTDLFYLPKALAKLMK
jgi:alkaline phosphatase